MSYCFQRIVPNTGLVICSCDMVLEFFGWRQIAGLCILAAKNSLYRTLSVSSLFPYSEHTNRAHPCCRSSSWTGEYPNLIMAAHMFGSDSTKPNARLLPFPTNALVLSHPVNACIPGSILHRTSPSYCPMSVMSSQSTHLLCCFIWIHIGINAVTKCTRKDIHICIRGLDHNAIMSIG